MNLLIRAITALVAVIILVSTLEIFHLKGAIVLVSVLSSLITMEIVSLFSKSLLRSIILAIITFAGIILYYQTRDILLSIMPHIFGIVMIPLVQRNKDTDVSYQNMLTQLIVMFYCFLLPICIYEILFFGSSYMPFYFFGLLVFGVDTFAYFFGRLFGKKFIQKPFQPIISPSKTFEGFLGSLLWPALLCLAFAKFDLLKFPPQFIFMIYITALSGISGDLIASLMKRKSKKKDSGKIMPGHGGLLDRLDSLLLSAPVFLFALRYFA